MEQDLNRFMKAQENSFEKALSEIKSGRKKKSLDVVHFSAV